MSVKLSEARELLLLAERDPIDPRLEPEDADKVLKDKLKQIKCNINEPHINKNEEVYLILYNPLTGHK